MRLVQGENGRLVSRVPLGALPGQLPPRSKHIISSSHGADVAQTIAIGETVGSASCARPPPGPFCTMSALPPVLSTSAA